MAVADSIALLLVEDDALILHLLEEELTDAGFTVFIASNGTEAITALDDPASNLAGIITDIRLGDGPSGWDVARHAREEASSFPVVYMTADSAGEWGAHGVPNSVLVQKPFAVAQVITAISTLLNDLGSSQAE
jgi:DNA-binding response OmpR family regulator